MDARILMFSLVTVLPSFGRAVCLSVCLSACLFT